MAWTIESMPNLAGKIAVVTGANSGLGYEAALGLVSKGAHVIIASRDAKKGQEAIGQIKARVPNATLTFLSLDLASLDSIKQFAETFSQQFKTLDLLINNAGVMHLPYRQTADGFEMQFGTNHLGHFALTGRLLPLILKTPKARVVTVSSGLHQRGHINFDDLQAKKAYDEYAAYSQSKLANLLFAYELERHFKAHKIDALSVAAHPGYAATNLQSAGPNMSGSRARGWMMSVMNALLAQTAAMGALPTLYAAVASDVAGGDYIGPDGLMEMRGYPTRVPSNDESHDVTVAKHLWQVSEDLTHVHYEFEPVKA